MLFTSYTRHERVNNRNAGNSANNAEHSVSCLSSHLVPFMALESLLRMLFPSWFGAALRPDETR